MCVCRCAHVSACMQVFLCEDMYVFILLICDFEVTGYTTKYDTHNIIFREGACVMVNNINMKDGQEGIKSFVEKRKPVWSHTHE